MVEELPKEISDIIIELPDKSGKSPIEDFILGQQGDMGVQEILNVLLEGDNNLDLKTHILKPKQLSSLKVLADVLKISEYPKSAALIESFLMTYLRYMISYKRLSRGEIIRALTTNVQEADTEGFKKLITDMK